MSLRDFLLIMAICLVWAANNVFSKIVVTDLAVPPLAFAALRFGVVAVVVSPWLFPAPKPLFRFLIVALLMGGVNFSLMFIGLQTATPSSSAIVLQMGVPMTILMAMIVLKEEVRLRRAIGIAVTLAGAMLVIWNPQGLSLSTGLLFVAASCFTYSIGAVMLRGMPEVKPLQLQAWVGFASLVALTPLTLAFERSGYGAIVQNWLPLAAAVLFSALITSVIAHTVFYGLIQRYDASLLQPLTQVTPFLTILGGVFITHDHFDLRMAFGAAITLVGVLIIVLRLSHVMPLLALLRPRA